MGKPIKLLTFDAESYYTDKANGGYSLTYMTPEEYIRDPRFDLIGFSLKAANGKAQWFSGDLDYLRSVVAPLPWDQIMVIGHNMAEFDSLILTEVLGVRPRAYACTLQMARAIHGGKQANSLGKLAELYGLKSKGHQVVNYINKRRLDFTPWQLQDYGNYCMDDSDICYDLFNLFVPQIPPNELWIANLSARMFAEPRVALDTPLLLALQRDMVIRKGELLGRVADILNVDPNLPFDVRIATTQGLLRKDAVLASVLKNNYDYDAPMKPSPKKKDANGWPLQVYAFAKTDEGMTEMLDYEDASDPAGAEDIQALAAARIGVKSTLAESRVSRFVGISQRGLLPVPLAFGKTHTSRLAGSQKINMQNLSGNKPVNERTPVGAIIVTPRGIDRLKKYNKKTGQLMCSDGTILSNKGKQFCYLDGKVVDASTPLGSQIMTPRGPDILKDYHLPTGMVMCADGTTFSNRGDEFCHVAGLRDTIIAPPGKRLVVADSSQIELRVAHLLAGQMDTVAELRAGIDVYSSFASTIYNRSITKADKRERQHGKVGMLQLQYQSGWKSFRNAARIMGGVRLTEDEAQGTVDIYRKRFTQLPAFWRKCQQAIPRMAKGGGGYIDQWGLCKLEAGKITMPGRMPLTYHNLREELLEGFNGGPPEMQWVYDDKEKRRMKKIYGGSVTENLCQWIARHVVFDQMLECERRWGSYGSSGNGVVLTVHDEIVMCVDENDADDCLAFALGVMGQPPHWWKELPVAAEGGIGIRYSEAK